MISIIGSGKVGSVVAFLICTGKLDDVILVNRTKSKAIGEALDLANAIPEDSPFSILGTDDYSRIRDSEIVVITASVATYTSSRIEFLDRQLDMINKIREKVERYASDANVLMVSNPLDNLTYAFVKQSSLSPKKVIGIASSLDSSRLRLLIAKELKVRPHEIKNALVFGEHGDSMVPIFSRIKHNEIPIMKLLKHEQINKIREELRKYWLTLREFKSRSVFGISKHVYDVIKAMKEGRQLNIPTSVLLEGQYGEFDVCMGVPTKIDSSGLVSIEEIELEQEEIESLHHSANILRQIRRQF